MRLLWDQEGQRTYETGVQNGVLFVYDAATKAYKTGVPWNGLTNITETPSGGEPTALYADNLKYLELMSVEELGIGITAYTYPPEFGMCDGSMQLAEGVTIGQQNRSRFGLAYLTKLGNDTEGDNYGSVLHLVYGCQASPSEKAYATINDSPEAIEFSWDATTTPITLDSVTGVNGETPKATSLLKIDSSKIDKDKFMEITDAVFGKNPTTEGGSDGLESKLLMPAEVLAILTPPTP